TTRRLALHEPDRGAAGAQPLRPAHALPLLSPRRQRSPEGRRALIRGAPLLAARGPPHGAALARILRGAAAAGLGARAAGFARDRPDALRYRRSRALSRKMRSLGGQCMHPP